MVEKTLREVAELVGGEVVGDETVVIRGACGIKEAQEGDLTFVANAKYLPLIHRTRASAIITSRDVEVASPRPLIRTDNPSLAFAKMVSVLAPDRLQLPMGIHPTAVIGERVRIGKDVAIQAYAVLEDDVEIGDGTVIYSGVFIGHQVRIGSGTIVYPNVSIRERVEIGHRVIIHSGTVIGSDGFGFSTVRGVHHKIPQIGTVVIEDDVEIGANVTIDRARFGRTLVGRGTKIDNLVQIAHNVTIGENSIIVSQVGISGSASVGRNVTLAGQVGLVGHIEVGDNSVVTAQSGVTKSVPPNSVWFGSPAKPIEQGKQVNACLQRLPRTVKTVEALQAMVARLEERIRQLEGRA